MEIISPEVITPDHIANSDFLKSNFKSDAAKHPVHAPVVGNGIATNINNPNILYFFIFDLVFLSVRSLTQFKGVLNILNLNKYFIIGFNIINNIGTINILPRIPSIIDRSGLTPSVAPNGIAPLTSDIGIILAINIKISFLINSISNKISLLYILYNI